MNNRDFVEEVGEAAEDIASLRYLLLNPKLSSGEKREGRYMLGTTKIVYVRKDDERVL